MIDTVNVSPIPAHFLLRRPIEQALMVGGALAASLPVLYPAVLVAWVVCTSDHPSSGEFGAWMFGAFALVALILGRVGWWIGRMAADLVCVLRARRELKAAGKL